MRGSWSRHRLTISRRTRSRGQRRARREFGEGSVILAGGQSLVPMLNLRLVQPSIVIDINRCRLARRWSILAASSSRR